MKAEIIIHQAYKIGEIDKRIYGSFVEHLGRSVYGGIYEPGHETAGEDGFRGDVLELVRTLEVPIVRYPGGNFVSGYRWEDGTGDKSRRPRRMELAWMSTEPNEVGIDEFQAWARQAGSDVMMAVNLGTRGPADAQNLVEYCNAETDTQYANMRRENGFDQPFGVKTWCLGNEMDGPWQICHKTAEEYGRTAVEAAKLMKWVDPEIQLVACGSSNYNMPTFGQWEYTVLRHAYDYVDYISLHQYYGGPETKNTADYLGRSEHMNAFIKSVAAICDAVKAEKHAEKTIGLSFDEWNVWHHVGDHQEAPNWPVAPALLEDVYTFEDALLVGSMLITLQNNCDRVKMACMAQLVNVIAPIMTETGGGVWKQTIFYPFRYASHHGRGEAMHTAVHCDAYTTSDGFRVPYVAVSAIHRPEEQEVVVFAVNRSLDEEMEISLSFERFGAVSCLEHVELYCEDLKAVNTKDCERVAPVQRPVSGARQAQQTVVLKKHSWNMLRFACQPETV